jgi:hypothetical protein
MTLLITSILWSLAYCKQVKILLAADNQWSLYIDPISAPTVGPNDWANVSTYQVSFTGTGPWVIGVKAHNDNSVRAFFSAIYVDGKPYTATGSANTRWEVSATEQTNWLSPTFQSATFLKNQSSVSCTALEPSWAVTMASFKRLSPDIDVHGMWLPDCNSGNSQDIWFRLVIDSDPVSPTSSETVSPPAATSTTAADTNTSSTPSSVVPIVFGCVIGGMSNFLLT